MADLPDGHPVEAALVRAAHNGGVKAPEVVCVLADGDGMGPGFVLRRVVAEVSPATIFAAPPPSPPADLGRELARIPALPRAAIPHCVPVIGPGAALPQPTSRFSSHGGPPPAP